MLWKTKDAYKSGKRFLYVSTDEVYGEFFIEETLVEPGNPYSASKAGAEMLVKAFGKTYGMSSHDADLIKHFSNGLYLQ